MKELPEAQWVCKAQGCPLSKVTIEQIIWRSLCGLRGDAAAVTLRQPLQTGIIPDKLGHVATCSHFFVPRSQWGHSYTNWPGLGRLLRLLPSSDNAFTHFFLHPLSRVPSPVGQAGEQLLEPPHGADPRAALSFVKESGDESRVALCSREAARCPEAGSRHVDCRIGRAFLDWLYFGPET